MSDTARPGSGDVGVKAAVSVVLAVVVGVVAAVAGAGGAVAVVAVVATAVAFWLLDGAVAASAAPVAADLAPPSTRDVPPVADQDALASPGSVEAPTVAEPAAPETSPPPPAKQGARLDPALFDRESVEIKTNSQGASRVFSIRIAKHGNSIAECEDAVSVDPRRSVLAVADGASSSFGANIWAETLARQFVKTPPKPLSVSSFQGWIDAARKATPEQAGGDASDPNGWWSEQGARQGAFSTVVGAAIMADGANRVVTVMCVGDSSAFVLTGGAGERRVRRSLPYEDAAQFGSHPALLGSMTGRPHDEPTWTTVPIGVGDLLVLASDAVSEWLLEDPKRFGLFDGDEPDAIAQRIVDERTAGRIVNDDMTIALIEVGSAR